MVFSDFSVKCDIFTVRYPVNEVNTLFLLYNISINNAVMSKKAVIPASECSDFSPCMQAYTINEVKEDFGPICCSGEYRM